LSLSIRIPLSKWVVCWLGCNKQANRKWQTLFVR